MTLRTRLSDLLFGGPVKRKPLPNAFDTPMVFGNCSDLDDAGLIAFCNGDAVNIRGERLLAKGEPFKLVGRFRLAAHGLIITDGNRLGGAYGCLCGAGPVVVLSYDRMGKRRLAFKLLELDGRCP